MHSAYLSISTSTARLITNIVRLLYDDALSAAGTNQYIVDTAAIGRHYSYSTLFTRFTVTTCVILVMQFRKVIYFKLELEILTYADSLSMFCIFLDLNRIKSINYLTA